jgi:hypothetical protein
LTDEDNISFYKENKDKAFKYGKNKENRKKHVPLSPGDDVWFRTFKGGKGQPQWKTGVILVRGDDVHARTINTNQYQIYPSHHYLIWDLDLEFVTSRDRCNINPIYTNRKKKGMSDIMTKLKAAKNNKALEEYFDSKGLELYEPKDKTKTTPTVVPMEAQLEAEVELIIQENEKEDNQPPDPFWEPEYEVLEEEQEEEEEETKSGNPHKANGRIDWLEKNELEKEKGIVPRLTRAMSKLSDENLININNLKETNKGQTSQFIKNWWTEISKTETTAGWNDLSSMKKEDRQSKEKRKPAKIGTDQTIPDRSTKRSNFNKKA